MKGGLFDCASGRVAAVVLVMAFAAAVTARAESGGAHPFHVSVAEVEFNPRSRRFEVALRMYALDAETALRRVHPKKSKSDFDFDNEKLRDQALAVYLPRVFTVSIPDGPKKPVARSGAVAKTVKKTKLRPGKKPKGGKLHLVGSEIVGSDVWAYFEITLPDFPRPGKTSATKATSPKPTKTNSAVTTLTLRNEVLFAEQAEQLNVVRLKTGSRNRTLFFSAKSKTTSHPIRISVPVAPESKTGRPKAG